MIEGGGYGPKSPPRKLPDIWNELGDVWLHGKRGGSVDLRLLEEELVGTPATTILETRIHLCLLCMHLGELNIAEGSFLERLVDAVMLGIAQQEKELIRWEKEKPHRCVGGEPDTA